MYMYMSRVKKIIPKRLRCRGRQLWREHSVSIGIDGRTVGALGPDQQLWPRLKLSHGCGSVRMYLTVGVGHPLGAIYRQVTKGHLRAQKLDISIGHIT